MKERKKWLIIAVFAIIGLLFMLTVCDNGSGSGTELPQPGSAFFSSSFESVSGSNAKLELRAVSGARSARSLADGTDELIAVIEYGSKLLRLEGVYDPTDGRFNLSAKSGDDVFTVVGMLNDKAEVEYAEILMGHKKDGEWEGDHKQIFEDPSVNITRSDFAQKDQGVPPSFLGRWDISESSWYLVSPFGMSYFYIEGGQVVRPDYADMSFVIVEQSSPTQLDVVTTSYPIDITAFDEKFGPFPPEGSVAMAMDRTGKKYFDGTMIEYFQTTQDFKTNADAFFAQHETEIMAFINENPSGGFMISENMEPILQISKWDEWYPEWMKDKDRLMNRVRKIDNVEYVIEIWEDIIEPWFAEWELTANFDTLDVLFPEDIVRPSTWEFDEWLLSIGCFRVTLYHKIRITFESNDIGFFYLTDSRNTGEYGISFTSLADAQYFTLTPDQYNPPGAK